MDKKSDFDLINQSWESSKNTLFGGESSLGSDPFSISSPLDSMASSLDVLDDNRDILGSGSSFPGLDMHHGMDDVLGLSAGSALESGQPDSNQSSLPESDIFKDLNSEKNNLGASETLAHLKDDFASDKSLLDFNHSLDHSLSKSDSGISFGTLGSDLLGDYGKRDYRSEFLSGSSMSEKTPEIELSASATDNKLDHAFSLDNQDDLMASPEHMTLSHADIESSVMETPVNSQFGLTDTQAPSSIAIAPIAEPESTQKELVPVSFDMDVSKDVNPSNDSDDDDEVYYDNSSLKEQYLSNAGNGLKNEHTSSIDSIEIGSGFQQEFESKWFGEYSGNSKFINANIDESYRSAMNNLVSSSEPDNYDYNYTGMQVSDAGWVAEDIEKSQTRENLGCGVTVVCVILILFTGVWAGFALIGIAGIITGVIVSTKYGNRAKELFKTYYVEATLKKNFYLKSYQPNMVLGEDLNRLELTSEEWNRSKVDDLIEGLYKGVRFIFKDIALDYNSGGKNSTTKKIFRGQVYETTLKHTLTKSIKYVRNLSPLMEYSGIKRYYMRYGSYEYIDMIESQPFVDAMVKLYTNLRVPALEVRLTGNRMMIVAETSEEWFELSGNLKDSVERLNIEIGRMMFIVNFMKECGIVFDKVRA